MGTKKIRDHNGKVVKEIAVLDKIYGKSKPEPRNVAKPRTRTFREGFAKKPSGFYVWYVQSFIYRLFKRVLDKKVWFCNHSFNFYMYQWFNGKVKSDISEDDVVRTVMATSPHVSGELLQFYYDKLKNPPETLLELGQKEERWNNNKVREHFLENHTLEVIYGENCLDPNKHDQEYDEEEFREEQIDEDTFRRPL